MKEPHQHLSYKIFNTHILEGKEFYEIVEKWWIDRKWGIQHPLVLSTNGIMIYNNDQPICAGWLYGTDSLMCVIGHIIADKTIGKLKKQAIKFLLIELENLAKQKGFKIIFFPIVVNSIAQLGAKELRYQNSGEKVNELIKII